MRGDIGEALQFGIRISQAAQQGLPRRLSLLGAGDVANDAGIMRLAVNLEGADRQVGGKGRTVLAPRLHFARAGVDRQVFADITGVFGIGRVRHQQRDRLADRFTGLIAENILARSIETTNTVVFVDGDNAVEHIVDDRPTVFLALTIERLQLGVCLFELRRTGKGQGLRHQANDHDQGGDGGDRRRRLDPALENIVRMPQHPDAQQVRAAAQQDKGAEQHENALKRQIPAFANEVDQGQRNAQIGQDNAEIRQDMQPQDARLPQEAVAVRHESVAAHFMIHIPTFYRSLSPVCPSGAYNTNRSHAFKKQGLQQSATPG